MEAFVILLIVVVVVAVVAAGVSKRETNLAWKQAGQQLGIRSKDADALSNPELFGKVRGCRIRVNARSDGEYGITRYRVDYPAPLGLGLRVTRDHRFDQDLRIKSRSPATTKQLLSESGLRQVKMLLTNLNGAVVEDSRIVYEARGTPRHSRDIVATVNMMVDAAQSISGYHIARVEQLRDAEYEEIEDAILSRSAVIDVAHGDNGDLGQASPMARELEFAPVEVSDPPDVPELSAAALVTSPGDISDVAEVCEAVFTARARTHDTASLFEHQYAGRTIAWCGRLMSASLCPFDRVFGEGPDARATLHVHELDDPYGSRMVQAVAQFPPATLDRLRSKIGREFRFTGTLVAHDPLLRVLYVSEAQIVD